MPGFFANLKAKFSKDKDALKGSKLNQFAFSFQVIFGAAMMAYAGYQIAVSVKSAGAPAVVTSVDQRGWVAVPSIFLCPLDSNGTTSNGLSDASCIFDSSVITSGANTATPCPVNTTTIHPIGDDINCWSVSLKDFPVLDSKTKTVSVTIKLQKSTTIAYFGFFNETIDIPRNPVIAPLSAAANFVTYSAIVEEFSSTNSSYFYYFGSKPAFTLPGAGTDTFTIHFATEDLTVYRHAKQVLSDPFVALTAIGGAVSLLAGVRDKVVNFVKGIANIKDPQAGGEDIELQNENDKKKKSGM